MFLLIRLVPVDMLLLLYYQELNDINRGYVGLCVRDVIMNKYMDGTFSGLHVVCNVLKFGK